MGKYHLRIGNEIGGKTAQAEPNDTGGQEDARESSCFDATFAGFWETWERCPCGGLGRSRPAGWWSGRGAGSPAAIFAPLGSPFGRLESCVGRSLARHHPDWRNLWAAPDSASGSPPQPDNACPFNCTLEPSNPSAPPSPSTPRTASPSPFIPERHSRTQSALRSQSMKYLILQPDIS